MKLKKTYVFILEIHLFEVNKLFKFIYDTDFWVTL